MVTESILDKIYKMYEIKDNEKNIKELILELCKSMKFEYSTQNYRLYN